MEEPELIIFDLDFTLWDCGGLWIDCTNPPFHLDSQGAIRDATGRKFQLYPEVPEILDSIECQIGIASRTSQPAWAIEVLELLGIRDRFDFEEIYPGSKIAHFNQLKKDSGIDFEKMIFFDDEHRNIVEVGNLGVKSMHVTNGLDLCLFQQGLDSG